MMDASTNKHMQPMTPVVIAAHEVRLGHTLVHRTGLHMAVMDVRANPDGSVQIRTATCEHRMTAPTRVKVLPRRHAASPTTAPPLKVKALAAGKAEQHKASGHRPARQSKRYA